MQFSTNARRCDPLIYLKIVLYKSVIQYLILTIIIIEHLAFVSQVNLLDGTKLVRLDELDLSSNRLSTLASFPDLPSLQRLYLQDNKISAVSEIQILAKKCPELTTLYLMNASGSAANPVCSQPSYRRDVLAALPRLAVLDGKRTKLAASADIYSLAEQTNFPSSTRDWENTNITVEDWFKDEDCKLTSVDAKSVQQASAPRVAALKSLLGECKRLTATADERIAEISRSNSEAAGKSSAKR